MIELIINIALIILASMYFGVIIGRQGNRKIFEEKVREATDKAEEQAHQQKQELAVELHGELSKIRDSIIDSAQAYQNVVKAVGEKLVPLEELAEQIGADKKTQLPLFAEERQAAEELRPEAVEAVEVEVKQIIEETVIDDDVGDTLPSATSVDADVIKGSDESESEPDTLEIDALKTSAEDIVEEGSIVR